MEDRDQHRNMATDVSEFWQKKYEREAAKNWDLFYKRNGDRFFKDRHWTCREFQELVACETTARDQRVTMLEVGCGAGNLLFPILEEHPTMFVYACDFSSRAVEIVKAHPNYHESRCKAFVWDITSDEIHDTVKDVDVCTMVFVLSAIHPDKMKTALTNVYQCLKTGGRLLFRDYAVNDHAQIRFRPSNRLADNFYVRQDGTRSYFFSEATFRALAQESGFHVVDLSYVYRQTVNVREQLDVERIFLQAKLEKR